MLAVLYGIEFPAGIFFQAIGKSTKSAIISLSRQLLFLVPAMIILGNVFGIEGLLFSGPVADSTGVIICTILLLFEVRKLNKKSNSVEENVEPVIENKEEIKNVLDKKIVITVSREYGSGGRYIAKLLAEKLGIKLYDKEFIQKVKEETGLAIDYIEETEQKRKVSDFINDNAMTSDDELFVAESNVINELYEKESCVIVGRCADFVLKGKEDVVNVFIYNSLEDKVSRAVKYYGLKEKDAQKEIKQINKQRANHYKHYTGKEWGKQENYDICINSDIGVEESVNSIISIINEKLK